MCLIISLVKANPYFYGGEVPPPAGTQPPKISVTLENNSLFQSSNISFKVTASSSDPINFTDKNTFVTNIWFLTDVWYTVDWKEGNNTVYHNTNYWEETTNLFRFVNLTGIPEGSHTIQLYANEQGTYVTLVTKYLFNINSSIMANFIVDSITPTISFSAPYQNKTFDTRDIVLNFTANKPDCQISYSLDNQSEISANSDTAITLNNLMNGQHNVTICAKDKFGALSAPITTYFDVKVPEPFPTITIVTVASILVIITGISIGLLIYRNKIGLKNFG